MALIYVRDVFDNLNALAPVDTKLDFDNVGLLLGDMEAPVTRVLLALDVTDRVIEEAKREGAQLIVAHHPMFFSLKHITRQEPLGARLLALAESKISEISMHTNLDAAQGGVNDALAAAIGLEEIRSLCPPEAGGKEESIPRSGQLREAMALGAWLPALRQKLSAPGLRYYDAGRPVKQVGVVGGSGGEDLELLARLGCDTVVTADVKYHVFQQAADLGVNLIDAGHFETETVVLRPLQQRLSAAFPELCISIAEENKGIIRYA